MAYSTIDLTTAEAKVKELEGRLQATKDALLEVLKTSASQEDELRALRGRTIPDCGGPDCKMVEQHQVNTCPKYSEEQIEFVFDESDVLYDNPD